MSVAPPQFLANAFLHWQCFQVYCCRGTYCTGCEAQCSWVRAAQFYAMVSFACPDLLGTLAAFRRVFADPISRARDRDASAEERALGAQRSAELARPTSPNATR